MGFGRYRFRRSFGNVGSTFRGARPDTYPLYTGVLDSYPGAAAAYSLRALSRGWLAGDVVEVRRSSDSTSQDFTASQITNGQMLSFVNHGTTDLYNSARYFNGTNTDVMFTPIAVGGTSTVSFDALLNQVAIRSNVLGDSTTNATGFYVASGNPAIRVGGSAFVFSTITILKNVQYNYTFERQGSNATCTVVGGGSTQSETRTHSAASVNINTIGRSVSGRCSGIISNVNINGQAAYTGLGTSVTAWEDTIGSNDGTESNGAAYTGQPFDGFVSTWYDQSGNANDATQIATASQPKIVDAGALVTGGLDFDGVDDSLEPSSKFLSSIADSASFVVATRRNSTTDNFLMASNAPSRLYIRGHDVIIGSEASSVSTSLTNGQEYLISACGSSGSYQVNVDGSSAGVAVTADTSSGTSRIGSGAGGTSPVDAIIGEVIVYDSDQASNCAGIETNINDHYSIYA